MHLLALQYKQLQHLTCFFWPDLEKMYKEVCYYGIIIDNAVVECSALIVIVFKLSENAARANPRNDQLKNASFQIKKEKKITAVFGLLQPGHKNLILTS